jgi:hypothetical protein
VVYGFASRGTANAPTAFLNYGYAVLDADDDGAPQNGPADRFGVQLYERVARGPELSRRTSRRTWSGRFDSTARVDAR